MRDANFDALEFIAEDSYYTASNGMAMLPMLPLDGQGFRLVFR